MTAATQNIGNVVVSGASTNLNMQTGLVCDGLTVSSGGKVTTGSNALTIGANGSTINTGTTLDATGTPAISDGGDWSSLGTFTAGSSTVTFNKAASTQSLTPGTGNNFFNLTHSGSGTLTLGGALTVNNNLTNSAGILNNATFDITVSGDWAGSG